MSADAEDVIEALTEANKALRREVTGLRERITELESLITKGLRQRNDTHNPIAWMLLPDGRMRSPTGRVYGKDTLVARRVRDRRHLLAREGGSA